MNFLDNLALPQSSEHIQLLHYLLSLLLFIFVPFISIIFGGAVTSLFFKRKGSKENNHLYLRFAKDVLDVVTVNKSVGVVLGIVPLIALILIFVQVLPNSNGYILDYLFTSLVLLIPGMVLVYTYKYAVTFNEIFNSFKNHELKENYIEEDISRLKRGSISLSNKTGRYGTLFLFFALWFFAAALTIAIQYNAWEPKNIVFTLFSFEVISRLLGLIFTASAFTGAVLLFNFFYWDGGRKNLSEEYKLFVKKTALILTSTGSILLPIFIYFDLNTLPDKAISSTIFMYTALALLLLFVVYHLLYAMIKGNNGKYSGQIFFIILFSIILLVIKDELAFNNSTKVESLILSTKYDDMLAKMKGQGKVEKISGEQIYKNICSACHSFDHKIVGPPYNQTLPKYEGKIDQLVAFIRNPTQNNPGYPPMPNPGLTAAQAKAVAEYIISNYKK